MVMLPEQYHAQYIEYITTGMGKLKDELRDNLDVDVVTKTVIAKSHALTMAFVAANNVRSADALTSLLYDVLLVQSEGFAKESVIDDLERLVGPQATANIYNWFSSYGKDLSALVRPRGTTLN